MQSEKVKNQFKKLENLLLDIRDNIDNLSINLCDYLENPTTLDSLYLLENGEGRVGVRIFDDKISKYLLLRIDKDGLFGYYIDGILVKDPYEGNETTFLDPNIHLGDFTKECRFPPAVEGGDYQHVLVVRGNGEFKVYVDGKLLGEPIPKNTDKNIGKIIFLTVYAVFSSLMLYLTYFN